MVYSDIRNYICGLTLVNKASARVDPFLIWFVCNFWCFHGLQLGLYMWGKLRAGWFWAEMALIGIKTISAKKAITILCIQLSSMRVACFMKPSHVTLVLVKTILLPVIKTNNIVVLIWALLPSFIWFFPLNCYESTSLWVCPHTLNKRKYRLRFVNISRHIVSFHQIWFVYTDISTQSSVVLLGMRNRCITYLTFSVSPGFFVRRYIGSVTNSTDENCRRFVFAVFIIVIFFTFGQGKFIFQGDFSPHSP